MGFEKKYDKKLGKFKKTPYLGGMKTRKENEVKNKDEISLGKLGNSSYLGGMKVRHNTEIENFLFLSKESIEKLGIMKNSSYLGGMKKRVINKSINNQHPEWDTIQTQSVMSNASKLEQLVSIKKSELTQLENLLVSESNRIIESSEMNKVLTDGRLQFSFEFADYEIRNEFPNYLTTTYLGKKYQIELRRFKNSESLPVEYKFLHLKKYDDGYGFQTLKHFMTGTDVDSDSNTLEEWYKVHDNFLSISNSKPMNQLIWGLNTNLERQNEIKNRINELNSEIKKIKSEDSEFEINQILQNGGEAFYKPYSICRVTDNGYELVNSCRATSYTKIKVNTINTKQCFSGVKVIGKIKGTQSYSCELYNFNSETNQFERIFEGCVIKITKNNLVEVLSNILKWNNSGRSELFTESSIEQYTNHQLVA